MQHCSYLGYPYTAAAFLYDECRIGEGEIKIDFGKIYWDLQA
jgi:hypothetical protein